jgi:hypothetical protein
MCSRGNREPKLELDMIEPQLISNYLKRYKDQLEKYTWVKQLKLDGLTEIGVLSKNNSIINEVDSFKRDEYLKLNLERSLKNRYRKNFNELCNWIIKDWGGINSGYNEKAQELVEKFFTNEKKSIGFDRIASVSKVLSFMHPKEYVIYDSRVVTSLNWIILMCEPLENKVKYFPVPEGRNAKIAAFNIETIIRLKNKSVFWNRIDEDIKNKNFISNRDEILFIDKKDAYQVFINLIKDINVILWEDSVRKVYPFYTEMLLFSLSDDIIFKEIVNQTHVEIRNQ